jgi:PAS domain S-box-containing protein
MEYKLQNLVDIGLFQSMLERLNELYLFPSAVIDTEGNVLAATAWQEICTHYHRREPCSLSGCLLNNPFIHDQINEAEPAQIFRCPRGLIDCVTPIIIEGSHLGYLFAGPFLLNKPDFDFYRQQASSLGFCEEAYLKEIEKIPILKQEQLDKYLALTGSLVEIIVNIGSKNLKEMEARKEIEAGEQRFKELFNAAPDAIFLADAETGIIINANTSASQLMDKSVPEIIGMQYSDLHPNWNEGYSRKTSQNDAIGNLKPEAIITIENNLIRSDGTEIAVEILASALIVNGQRVIQGIFRDISHRKKIESELLSSEEKHRKLTENLPDIVARFDKDLRYIFVNKVAQDFSGIPVNQFIGKTNEDLNMPHENAQFWNENLIRVFESGKQINFEFDYHSDISTHHFSALLVPEFDGSGKVNSVLSVTRDITGLRNSKNSLKVQRDISFMLSEMRNLDQTLKNLLDFCIQLDGIDSAGIYLIDQLSGNINLAAHCGLSNEFIQNNSYFPPDSENAIMVNGGKSIFLTNSDLEHPDNKTILQENIRSLAILPILHKGKAIACFNLASRKYNEIPMDDRIVLEAIASNLGGTIQRIRIEDQLKESETKYKLAFKTSPDAVNITTLDGIYVDINEGFTASIGYTKEEVIGKSSLELNIWAIPEDRKRLVSELKENGKINNLESVFRAKDGTLRTALMSANIITIHGKPHILSMTRDISERKRAEVELLIAKEKAEESNRLKTAFLANLSHELRTPMNGILGFTELLDDDTLTKETRNEYISVINDSGQSLLEVITNLMDISKIDSRQIDSRLRTFNVNSLLKELLFWFKSERIMRDKSFLKIELFKALSDEDANITSDSGKIRHIISLLLNNAAKFSSQGFIHFGYSMHGKTIRFFVQDSGKGISKDKQSEIFDRFRQEDETMSRKFGGVGLGLTISRGLVEHMGGHIGVDSEPGKGSTFWFEVPLQ